MSVLGKVALCLGKSALRTANQFQMQKCLFSLSTVRFNAVRKYTDKHEWISVSDNVGTIGITDYAQDKLGEVVYAELPEVGTEYGLTEQFATLESVKAVSECYTPVSGSVVESNESVTENPTMINKSPLTDGWLIKLNLANPSELDALMNEEQYQEFLKSEDH